MTTVYFVSHAEPDHNWIDDRTRPLTEEGNKDTKKILEYFQNTEIDSIYSSPYIRSIETIKSTAEYFKKPIHIDERLRERKAGNSSNNPIMFEKRWKDLSFHEENGESILEVQNRNIDALKSILKKHTNENIIISHHGTAMASVLNYFDNKFGFTDFMKILNLMPYIMKMTFKIEKKISKEEVFI